MRIVVQCAASKDSEAGYFRAADGRPIKFVAHPEKASAQEARALTRPDDLAGVDHETWRDLVAKYNEPGTGNPFGLSPAHHLYSNSIYGALVERFGADRVFVLSAGWGLIRSDFLTPQYDITFSASAEPFKRRTRRDRYADFNQLTTSRPGKVAFFGGKDYLRLFCDLTATLDAERIIFFNSQSLPNAPGCRLVRYRTTLRTNWHYACIRDLLSGNIALP